MNVVILAAGQGKRMHSDLPKVLHPLAGRPLLAHVDRHRAQPRARRRSASSTAMAASACARRIDRARPDLGEAGAAARHRPCAGAGAAAPESASVPTLVLYGDVPLTRAQTLQALCQAAGKGVALLTVELDDPHGYGRIVRSRGSDQAHRRGKGRDRGRARAARNQHRHHGAADRAAESLARRPEQQERAERVLPHRRGRGRGGGQGAGQLGAAWRGLGNPGRQQQGAAGRTRAHLPAQTSPPR